ncbi:MAG: hypothetical protein ACE5H9_10490 [Anaerolineae bacterium]
MTMLPQHIEHQGISRVLGRAIIDQQFCQLLLADPSLALRDMAGLSDQDRCLLLRTRADTIEKFAWDIFCQLGEGNAVSQTLARV